MNRYLSPNHVELHGTIHGESWTSYGRGERGRVNFWLAVSRELAGQGVDMLRCAIEPRTGEEVLRLERELRDGRSVRLWAHARSQVEPSEPVTASTRPEVVFIAEECGLDGEEARNAHRVGVKHHAHGKAAAAGDADEGELLVLGSEVVS